MYGGSGGRGVVVYPRASKRHINFNYEVTMKKADMIIDLQYGSTGKGLIAGYLGHHGEYDMVINANMPNAGHTFIDAKGQKMIHKVLPNGLVGSKVKDVMIGPGSIFSLGQLEKELDDLERFGYNNFDLWIHEDAVVLRPEHKHAEQTDDVLANIGSTQQGTAAAMIQKLMRNEVRNPTAKAALGLMPVWKDRLLNQHDWLLALQSANEILIEGAQGYSLGINAGFYPYCTSRDCTPARFLADCGVPLQYLRRTIGTARLHPIRVGGNSGGHYLDQEEITWQLLGQPEERTTVTNKVRRIFTWSQTQIEEALLACQPEHVFLNFCNYAPATVEHVKGQIIKAGHKAGYSPIVAYTGWGPTINDVKARMQDPCEMTRVELARGNG